MPVPVSKGVKRLLLYSVIFPRGSASHAAGGAVSRTRAGAALFIFREDGHGHAHRGKDDCRGNDRYRVIRQPRKHDDHFPFPTGIQTFTA